MVLQLREQSENREGTIQQKQRERDDEKTRQKPENPNGPDNMDADANAGEPEVIVTDMAPPPPRAPRTSAATEHQQNEHFLMKERIWSWHNPDRAQQVVPYRVRASLRVANSVGHEGHDSRFCRRVDARPRYAE